jgi:hypothetical protein
MVASWPGREVLAALLAEELGDPAAARAFAEIVFSDVLQWRPPMVAPTEIQTIVAYSFGNRIEANGNRSLGPVNASLADVVVRLHEETSAPVFAQWEVAEAIGGRIASRHLVSITPLRDARSEPVYLSTGGVAAAIVRQADDPGRLGKVAVVGFADHIKRCSDTSCRAGLDAAAPAGYGWELAVRTERGEMLKVLEADPTPGDATTNFLTALRSGTPVACSFAAAGVSTAVVEQAFASARAGGSWIDLG